MRKDVDGNGLEIIRSLIRAYHEDPNLLIMEDDYEQRLEEQNLLTIFKKTCKELGIKWRYDSNLPRE